MAGAKEAFNPHAPPHMAGAHYAGQAEDDVYDYGGAEGDALGALGYWMLFGWSYDYPRLYRRVYLASYATLFALVVVILVRQTSYYNHVKDHVHLNEERLELILEELAIPFDDRRDLDLDLDDEEMEGRSGGGRRGPSIGKCVADIFNGDGHEQGWSKGHWRKWDEAEEAAKHDRAQKNNGVKAWIEQATTEIIDAMCEKFDDQNECIADIKDRLGLVEDNTNTVEVKDWPMWSRTADGYAHAPPQVSNINAGNADTLEFKCEMQFGGVDEAGNNAVPTFSGDMVYFTSGSSGLIHAYNRHTCDLVYTVSTTQLFEDHIPASGADVKIVAATSNIENRQSPTIFRRHDGQLVAGMTVPSGRFACVANGSPFCIGLSTYYIEIDALTGEYSRHLKITDYALPTDFFAQHAGSMTYHDGHIYTGTSSFGNVFTAFGIPCTHIGQMIKLNVGTAGAVTKDWNTYMLPTDTGAGGWCGANPWGRYAVDPDLNENGTVVIGTGNAHYHPADVEACFTGYTDITDPENWSQAIIDCHAFAVSTYNHPIPTDSIVALDLDTGNFLWTKTPGGLDTFNTACGPFGPHPRDGGGVGCHGFMGPDWDMASTITIADLGHEKRVIGGSKSGSVVAVDGLNGDQRWYVKLGKGGLLGGIHWGGSYNPTHQLWITQDSGDAPLDPYTGQKSGFFNVLAGGSDGGAWVCNAGTMHAIDVHTGNIVWQNFDPWGNVSDYSGGSAFDDFPDSCWVQQVGTVSTDIFSKVFNYSNTAGQVVNASQTASLGKACPRNTDTTPEALREATFARMHGLTPNTEENAFFVSTTGNIYVLDTRTGDCQTTLGCPRGGFYGGPSLFENQVAAQCGAGLGSFDPNFIPSNGNITVIWELS